MYIAAWVIVAFSINAAGIVQPVALQQSFKTQEACVAAADQLRKQVEKAPSLACIPQSKSPAADK